MILSSSADTAALTLGGTVRGAKRLRVQSRQRNVSNLRRLFCSAAIPSTRGGDSQGTCGGTGLDRKRKPSLKPFRGAY